MLMRRVSEDYRNCLIPLWFSGEQDSFPRHDQFTIRVYIQSCNYRKNASSQVRLYDLKFLVCSVCVYFTLLHCFLPLSSQPRLFPFLSHLFLSYLSRSTSLTSTLLTPVGVPDAPRITIDGDTLSWEAPNDRGSPITAYRITAMWVLLHV